MSLVFLKLGGSAITDKTREATPKPDVIRDAARAIQSALKENPDLQILLGHGSGSFGHFTAKKFGFADRDGSRPDHEFWRAYAETGASAQRLNRLVTDIFLEQQVPVVSMQPSASARTRDGELYALAVANIRTALAHNLIPLIYGDVAFDDTLDMAITSTDALFAYLAPVLNPARIIYVTAVSGIYTSDPLKNPDAHLIREITPATFEEIRAHVGEAHGVDVTGGMLDKLARSVALVQSFPNIEILIVAARPEMILNSLLMQDSSDAIPLTRIYNPPNLRI
jgi:isopentenyl phosphate kinase